MAEVLAKLRRQATSPPRYLYGRGWYHWDRSWRRLIPFPVRLAVSRLLRGTTPPQALFSRESPSKTHTGDYLDAQTLEGVQTRISANCLSQTCGGSE
jgi:hypothetical protein